MTGGPTTLALAMAGAATLQLLGASLALTLLRGRHRAFCLASGLLWGAALHGVLAAAIVLTRQALGALPLHPTPLVAASTALASAAALGLCLARAAARGARPLPLLAAQLTAAALVALATALALAFDLSTLTPDSLGIIEAALGLARLRDPLYAGLPFLGSRGLLGVLLHAPADALGLEFLWFASPLLALSCLASLACAGFGALRTAGADRATATGAVALGLAWLLGCYFWTWQIFYVHVNLLAGAWLLLFFVAAWRSLVDEDDAWLPLAGLALLGFQMLRVEGTLFAALATGVLVLERAAAGRPRRPELWLVLPGALWCGLLAHALEGDGGLVDAPRLLAMAGLLLGCLGLAAGARHAALAPLRERLPGAAAGALLVFSCVLVVLRPEHMIGRLGILAWNAVGIGLWSTTWAFVPAFALAAPLLGRVPHQRFVQLGLATFFLGLFDLTFVGHWRAGWYDSGNRMLGHALPTLVWLGVVRAGAILPPRADRRRAERSPAPP